MSSKICQGQIHFIGIGGIGVSALAQYYLARGCKVSGSDLAQSEITDLLEKKGAKIYIGRHKNSKLKPQNSKIPQRSRFATLRGKQLKTENYKLPDLVIYSPAVKPDNTEVKEAKRLGIRCQSYPEALGELTKQYFTIAVSGTHGKSTTTAMIALILIKAGLNPTVILGTKLKEFGNSNFRLGSQAPGTRHPAPILLIEADEHMASFLHYWPKIIVLTNIEADHLDYYKNLNNILKAFRKYIEHLPKDGWLVTNQDDKNIVKLLNCSIVKLLRIKRFSPQQKEAKKLRKVLKVPGEHNVANALVALATARTLKIPDRISFKVLSQFRGTWRRFETHHKTWNMKHITIVSDYAHHPTEILATLKAARAKYPKRRIWCVYQPHQYQRTHYLFKDFVRVFSAALAGGLIDKLVLTKIYDVAGREESKISQRVSSKILAEEISKKAKNTMYIEDMNQAPGYIKKYVKTNDVIIIMGAGSIYALAEKFS